MTRKRRFFVAGALFAGYLALCCLAGVFVAETTLHPGRRMLEAADGEICSASGEGETAFPISNSLPCFYNPLRFY